MEKIKQTDIDFGTFRLGYEFRIKKFTTEKEWNLCSELEEIMYTEYKYNFTIHDLDDIGFVVFNVYTQNDSPIEIMDRIVNEINKLITN